MALDLDKEGVFDSSEPVKEAAVIAELGHLSNGEDHELTIRQALKTQTASVMWALFAAWTILLAAYDSSAAGLYLSIPKFREDFGNPYEGDYVLPASWQSAFAAAPVATAIIGALTSAAISDVIGRKYTVMGSLVISYAAISLEMVATTDAQFFGAEFMNGFSVGTLGTVCVTYIGEVAPLPLRGVLNCITGMAYTIAPFFTSIILQFVGTLDTRWAYRSLFVSQYGFAFVSTVFVIFMPESPWWLVQKEQDERALQSLRKLGHKNGDETKRLAYIKLTLEEVKKETEGVTYFECFRKSNLRRTIIAIAPLSIQALSGVSWMAGYSTYYMELAGYSTYESFTLTVIINVVSIIGNVMSWFLIDRFGRRDLQFWGLFGLTAMLLIAGGLATQTKNTSMIKGVVALIMLYNWWYGVTIGSTAYVLLCEVATSRLRGKTIAIGFGVQNAIYLMWSFVLPYMFNPDEANMGAKVAFVFGGLCVICLVYLYFCQPETTGRSYEELDELFMKRVPARKFKDYITDAEKFSQAATVAQNEELKK
ncbi:MFS hexose transporter [Xylariales sp. PMI_506]|nr:MFS hexose transporter [Xylariales sp. PMI_506]